MSVIVSKGNSPHNVSSGAPESSDSVVSGGSMFVLSGGTAFATTVSSGGFLTINKGGSGSGSVLSGGSERVSGTEIGGLIQSGGSQRVFTSGKAIGTGILGNGVQDVSGVASGTTIGSRGLQNVDALGTAFGTTVNSGGLQSVHSAGKTSGTILNPFGQEDVGPFGLAVSTTVNSGATLTISSGGTTSGATIGNGGQMLVSAGGVAADVTLNPGAVTSNAGIIKANSFATAVVGGVVTNANTIEALGSGALVQIFGSVTGSGSGTLLAVGSGARVELNGATISGGKLQTKSGGVIDVDFGVLSGATIVSGSIVDIGDADTLTLVGSAANSGVISMLGSANPATLTISGAMVLSGGGKVLLGPGGNNRIVAAAGGATLSNVNNTIAGAGNIGPGGNLVVVNAGKLEGTTSGTLFLNTSVNNTSAGVILASGVAARVELNGATISGGKLQTLAGGEIDADFGSLTDTTIASGSVVKINDGDTLILSGLINNLGVISALGSANPARLAVSGTVVLSGGGKVSLSSSGNNQIGSAGSELARGDEWRDAYADQRNDRGRSGCGNLDRWRGVGERHCPQFRHPVREWLQQHDPDCQRRRRHGRRCRDRRRHRLYRGLKQRKRRLRGEWERRAGLERVRPRFYRQGFRFRCRQFRALGPRSVHRLRRCQRGRKHFLHLGKCSQYQRYSRRQRWRPLRQRASRRQLHFGKFLRHQCRWAHQNYRSGGGATKRQSRASDQLHGRELPQQRRAWRRRGDRGGGSRQDAAPGASPYGMKRDRRGAVRRP
jgi:autotransporter passenger strand-loop-strand repeat protein